MSLQKSTTLEDLLVPGDVFEVNETELDYIIQSPIWETFVKSRKLIKCVVLRVYIQSSIEVVYVCAPLARQKREFALHCLLENLYGLEIKQGTALDLQEARKELGIKGYGPNLYKKEDAERIKKWLEGQSKSATDSKQGGATST